MFNPQMVLAATIFVFMTLIWAYQPLLLSFSQRILINTWIQNVPFRKIIYSYCLLYSSSKVSLKMYQPEIGKMGLLFFFLILYLKHTKKLPSGKLPFEPPSPVNLSPSPPPSHYILSHKGIAFLENKIILCVIFLQSKRKWWEIKISLTETSEISKKRTLYRMSGQTSCGSAVLISVLWSEATCIVQVA